MDTILEKNLLEQASQGDTYAFERFILNYEKLIFNISYKMLNNIEKSRQLTIEIIVEIFKDLNKCKDIKNAKGYVCSVAIGMCNNERRKNIDTV